MGSILAEQNLYTRAGEFAPSEAGDDSHLITAWKKNLGHNNSAPDQNRAAGFSGFTYAPHDLNGVMGGATPTDQRLGPQGNRIRAGGLGNQYGPEAFSRLSNRVDGAPPKSLLGAFAQMLSSHGTGWRNEGMKNTIASSSTLRSARNRTVGINNVPESSGGWADLYDATHDYRLTNWNAVETLPADNEAEAVEQEETDGADVSAKAVAATQPEIEPATLALFNANFGPEQQLTDLDGNGVINMLDFFEFADDFQAATGD